MSKFRDIIELNHYLFSHWRGSFFSLICGVISNLSSMSAALYATYICGLAFSCADENIILNKLPLLFIIIIIKGIFSYIHMYVCHDMAYKILKDVRMDLYRAVAKRSLLIEREYRTGELGSIVMEDVELLEVFYAHIIVDYFIAFVCSIIYVIFLTQYSLWLALVCLVLSVLILIVPYIFTSINSKRAKIIREEIGIAGANMVDSIQGIEEIVIFGREDDYINKIKDTTQRITALEMKDSNTKGTQKVILQFLTFLAVLIILIGVNILGREGLIESLDVPLLIVFSLNLFVPLIMVSNTAERIDLIFASARRINKLLKKSSPVEINDKYKGEEIDSEYLIEIQNLHFSYDLDKEVLKGINLKIRRGENIAIIGSSGAGKSTLGYLILLHREIFILMERITNHYRPLW